MGDGWEIFGAVGVTSAVGAWSRIQTGAKWKLLESVCCLRVWRILILMFLSILARVALRITLGILIERCRIARVGVALTLREQTENGIEQHKTRKGEVQERERELAPKQ